jgi:hypothetical protein
MDGMDGVMAWMDSKKIGFSVIYTKSTRPPPHYPDGWHGWMARMDSNINKKIGFSTIYTPKKKCPTTSLAPHL